MSKTTPVLSVELFEVLKQRLDLPPNTQEITITLTPMALVHVSVKYFPDDAAGIVAGLVDGDYLLMKKDEH